MLLLLVFGEIGTIVPNLPSSFIVALRTSMTPRMPSACPRVKPPLVTPLPLEEEFAKFK